MMKIGIISFHNAANHGASLQAYALEKFLEINGILVADCKTVEKVEHVVAADNSPRKGEHAFRFALGTVLGLDSLSTEIIERDIQDELLFVHFL